MSQANHFDVIIIGTGAGGGTLAYALAPPGKRILLLEPIAPKWTLDLMATHSLDFWLTSEDLPDPENRVTLDRKGDIVLTYRPNNEEGHKRLIAKLQSLMKQQTKCAVHGHKCHEGLFARNLFVGQRIPLAGVAFAGRSFRPGIARCRRSAGWGVGIPKGPARARPRQSCRTVDREIAPRGVRRAC